MRDVHQYYPTGYRVLIKEGARSEIDTDQELRDLVKMYRLNPMITANWVFKHQVIQAVKRLFGRFDEFLLDQASNRKLNQNALDLLVDTVRFINCGQREVALDTRLTIMKMDADAGELNKRHPTSESYQSKGLLKVPVKDVYWHWMQHRGGFDDMFKTATLIFCTDLV